MRENMSNALKELGQRPSFVVDHAIDRCGVKDRDIAARGNDKPDGISDDEILQHVANND